jgi:hypothetical protein
MEPDAGRRARWANRSLLLVMVFLWAIWCGIFVYNTVIIPNWQRQQAAQIEKALYDSCGVRFAVPTASVRPSTKPYWEYRYPPTGNLLQCQHNTEGLWQCSGCG